MTMAEKILARAADRERTAPNDFVTANIDKAIAHEGFAAVIKHLESAGIRKVWDTEKIIVALDHYVPPPTPRAAIIHQIVRQGVEQLGIVHFYDINEGVAHQVMMEKGHTLPGELIVGTDSHTCTYGALGVAACGIGVSEMAYVAATGKLWFRVPETIRFILSGELNFPVTAKDAILKIAGDYSADFAQYKSIEFVGPGATAISISGRMTMCNMAVEIGAKFGLFAPDEKTRAFLPDNANSEEYYSLFEENSIASQTLEMNLSTLSPQIALPHSVDNVRPISEVKDVSVHQAVLGSCTNGRLEDLQIAATLIEGKKVHPKTRLLVVPASREIYSGALSDGTLMKLIDAGAVILNPGCGPCFGGHMGLLAPGENCISSTNRNFKGRMGSDEANIYLASPATVIASAITGRISDPRDL